mgnify:CR=1 FL=1
MSVLYLLSPESAVRKDGGRLVVEKDGNLVARMPLRTITSVVVGASTGVTIPVLFACMEERVPVFFVDRRCNVVGQLAGETITLCMLRHQVACMASAQRGLVLAKEVVAEKLRGQYRLLKTYEKTVDDVRIAKALRIIKPMQTKIVSADTADVLRGMEGRCARAYFAAFPALLDVKVWSFRGRGDRPARDPVNALLNYGYAFLEREVRLAVIGHGLDVRIGFLHVSDGRRSSLVFDLMEVFRAPLIDRFVLSLLRKGCLKPENFETTKEDGCRLCDEARAVWYERYEAYMEKPYQEYEGKTPRARIDASVEVFAQRVQKAL